MRVQVGTPGLLAELSASLSSRGWSPVHVGETEADVLIAWDRDEFAAALLLRGAIAALRLEGDLGEVSIDQDLWRMEA